MEMFSQKQLTPGQKLARGAARHLTSLGYASIEEFVPSRGLRVDIMALGPKGELWIVECKSSREDFTSDDKWHNYIEWCDRYFWAVDADFPTDLLPDDHGLMIADAYDGEIIRNAPLTPLAAARRHTTPAAARNIFVMLRDLPIPAHAHLGIDYTSIR